MKKETKYTLKYILPLFIILLALIAYDVGMGENAVEEGIVVWKTFDVPEDYGEGELKFQHILVLVQSDYQKAYYFPVTRDLFYDVQPKDRLLIGKKYGALTGKELQAVLLYSGNMTKPISK